MCILTGHWSFWNRPNSNQKIKKNKLPRWHQPHIYIYIYILLVFKSKNQEPEFFGSSLGSSLPFRAVFFSWVGASVFEAPESVPGAFQGLGSPKRSRNFPWFSLDGKHMKNIWKIHEDPKNWDLLQVFFRFTEIRRYGFHPPCFPQKIHEIYGGLRQLAGFVSKTGNPIFPSPWEKLMFRVSGHRPGWLDVVSTFLSKSPFYIISWDMQCDMINNIIWSLFILIFGVWWSSNIIKWHFIMYACSRVWNKIHRTCSPLNLSLFKSTTGCTRPQSAQCTTWWNPPLRPRRSRPHGNSAGIGGISAGLSVHQLRFTLWFSITVCHGNLLKS
jgi:hypothetical protein